MSDWIDFYALLQLDHIALPEQITKQYRRIALTCHPDKYPGDRDKLQEFLLLNKAYDTLTDIQKKVAYDLEYTKRKEFQIHRMLREQKKSQNIKDLEERERTAQVALTEKAKEQEQLLRIQRENQRIVDLWTSKSAYRVKILFEDCDIRSVLRPYNPAEMFTHKTQAIAIFKSYSDVEKLLKDKQNCKTELQNLKINIL